MSLLLLGWSFLKMTFAFWTFGFLKSKTFVCQSLCLCCWRRDYIQMDTNPWDEAIDWESSVIKSCAPTPQTWQFFDLTVVFSSFSCRSLVETMSLACEDQVPCKLLCKLLKRPTSSILIGSVRWRLTYHWQDSFTVVHHFVSDGENSAWDQVPAFVRYWNIQSRLLFLLV